MYIYIKLYIYIYSFTHTHAHTHRHTHTDIYIYTHTFWLKLWATWPSGSAACFPLICILWSFQSWTARSCVPALLIAFSVQTKCGSEVATQFLWDALHSLTTDDIDNPRPVLSLSDCLLVQEGAPETMQHSSLASKPIMVASTAAGLEAGTQTLEAVITHAE